MQPYLAKKLDVNIDTVILVWTFGFVGFIIGSLVAGFVFRRFCKRKQSKMWFLAITFSVNGVIMLAIPFINNFVAIVLARCIQNICIGAYIIEATRGPPDVPCLLVISILQFIADLLRLCMTVCNKQKFLPRQSKIHSKFWKISIPVTLMSVCFISGKIRSKI